MGLLFAVEKAAGTSLVEAGIWISWAVGGAVLSFCFAGLVAIQVTWPTRIAGAVELTDIKELMRGYWNDTSISVEDRTCTPQQAIALQEACDLEDWEKSNDQAFLRLRAALVAEVVGIILVGIVVVALLATPPP
ncbi:hypothetical protein ACH9EU_00750 [Kocuria sp. M1R5S2]|uniref:hypothetical protein n=1 Tax=Kocuria rhizosphaerae TaxID=3376285 RepID=UPI0037BBC1BE